MDATRYYHGGSDVCLPTGSYRLMPPNTTGRLSEVGRKKNLDRVFFTLSYGSALIYAGRAVARFGGHPVVYRVIPQGEVECIHATPGTEVFCAEGAFIESAPPA